ncbi:hypothetical protein [Inquilinus sp. CA228]|uniref:hypothetical protein n=1 Tax=Inquilinus sp. CA228 TaxID=3455609 RepID=UPI003F8CF2AD
MRIRLPPGLKLWLEDQAKRNVRSISGEIVFRLEEGRRNDEAAREARERGDIEATPDRLNGDDQ